MTLDDLTKSLFGEAGPTAKPANRSLFGSNDDAGKLSQALMAAGGPQFMQQPAMLPQGGGGPRGPFPFFAPPINPMPIQAQIPNFAALLKAIRQQQPAPFSLAPPASY